MNLRSVAPSLLLGVVIGPVAAAVVDTPGQAPGGVTIYRCTDERGHLVALRDIAPGEELLEDYTFCLSGGLAPNHWLRPFYLAHHPDHYNFLLSLQELRVAA